MNEAAHATPGDGVAAAARACGTCNACCKFPSVEALQKPAGELCRHAGPSGCQIYATRPTACRTYSCLWLDGEFEDGDRPDTIGIVFDLPGYIEDHPDYENVLAICAREMRPGARDEARGSALLRRLAGVMVVRLSTPDGVQLLGPRSQVELLVERAGKRQALAAGNPE